MKFRIFGTCFHRLILFLHEKTKRVLCGKIHAKLSKKTADVKKIPLFFCQKPGLKTTLPIKFSKICRNCLKSTFLGLHSPGQDASNSSAKCMSQQQNFRFFQLFDYFLKLPQIGFSAINPKVKSALPG